MRAAIVGSGMAAVGVLDALARSASKVTLIDYGRRVNGPFELDLSSPKPASDALAQFYAYLRREHGWKFPPPKTHFGAVSPTRSVAGWGQIWDSSAFGGLTNFWGGAVLPFTDRDLRRWPLLARDLAPYYFRAAERIGVSGRRDALSEYFAHEHLTRPPIKVPPVIAALETVVSRNSVAHGYRLIPGLGRLALETRPGAATRCDFTGECMVGCAKNAIYNAREDLAKFEADGLIERKIVARVLSVDRERTIKIETRGNTEVLGPYDRIYLAAGCPGSTEIVMRSLDVRAGPLMTDNAVYTFPIVYFGSSARRDNDSNYFALTNLMIVCEPSNPDAPTAMLQIYPVSDHLWRYLLPIKLWGAFAPIASLIKRHLLFGRLYLHGDFSQRYVAKLDDNTVTWLLHREPTPLSHNRDLWRAIRSALGHSGFFVPSVPPILHRTSSHYSASMPLASPIVDRWGQVFPGVFVCDSASFVDAPATSPSLSIFAHAARIASTSL